MKESESDNHLRPVSRRMRLTCFLPTINLAVTSNGDTDDGKVIHGIAEMIATAWLISLEELQ